MRKLPGRILAVAIVVAGLLSVRADDPADTYPELHLIPWPKRLRADVGILRLTPGSRIVAQDERLLPLAEVLASEIETLTGLEFNPARGAGHAGDIVLKIDPEIRAEETILVLRNREPTRTTDGAHAIFIDQQAVVAGFDYRAVAEGTSTLLQLLGRTDGQWRLPKLTIKDWPHADYCGVLLDVARQDHPIDAIKQVVQLCRLYKARYLQLHLTDDQGWTFPSTRYPQLGSQNYGTHGGVAPRVYDLHELKALVAYADARGVTLVPEFEVPGHSGAAVRSMPEVFDAINLESKQPVGIGCMNMSNEELYPVLDTIVGEMCDVFHSSPYFHIGSDEVTSGRLSLHSGYQAFMNKHGLKNDSELAEHFVREVCGIVRRHGKKAIKWEGLANFATDDVIIMAWEVNSTLATEALARGYTTITCPWTLAVPWEQWNMYRCNGSQLKPGDSVLGATLVAWEQPPLTHITNLRQLAGRQERTWGPDNHVTEAGFAARFQPLDAVAGKLLDLPPKPQWEAALSTSAGTQDFLEPVFAIDGNDATYFQSAAPPRAGDHFTVSFPTPQQVYAIEILTGINQWGLLEGGEVQVSTDGEQFTTVAALDQGAAQLVLKENLLRAVRLRARSPQSEPLVVRAINFRLMNEVAGAISNPAVAIGAKNVAVTKGDTEFAYPIGACAAPVINRNHTLTLNNGGNACSYSGPISGSGRVEIFAGGPEAPLVIDGTLPNTLQGTWSIKAGRVVLAKPPGADALGGTILVGGHSDHDSLFWNNSDQVQDDAEIVLKKSVQGAAMLYLNGFSEKIGRLDLEAGAKVLTSGGSGTGVLTVRELIVEGTSLPAGVYTSSSGWLQGTGYVVVGELKRVDVSGLVEDPAQTIGLGNMAVLKSPGAFGLPDGDCSISVDTGGHLLTLSATGESAYSGFITGRGALRINAAADRRPLEISGTTSNSYQGTTTLGRGVLKLNKHGRAIAIPGHLTLGGSETENQGDGVVWGGDGQVSPSAVVILQGTQPSFLDLAGHEVVLGKVVLSPAGSIRTGEGGVLSTRQLFIDGRRLGDGKYEAPLPWMTGSGKVLVDARVDVQGIVGAPEAAIGAGNVANLTGPTKFAYPAGGCHVDVITNGFTLTLDSGDGNAFSCTGSISGTGDVEFFMGPSYTSFKDAPLPLAGDRPNTATGRFFVRKGRVQLEKPPGIDAISGDVIVGGQGFNDGLFWTKSDQLKDTVNITLLSAGNNGAAYLDLNGQSETAASLSMTAHNSVRTDSPDGRSGTLTVHSLTIDDERLPAGVYTRETAKWLQGAGQVIVQP